MKNNEISANYFVNSNLSLPLFSDRHANLILLKSSTF